MLTTRCYALWRDDDLEDSARACSQALDIDEDYIPAYVNYANAKLAANDVEAAARILDEARDVNPKAPGVLSNRAHVATLMGDFELATKLLDFALSLDPGNEVLLGQKRDLQRAQGGTTEDGVLGSVADDLITVGGGQ
jgi:tetratricopeptide (TPR) repeat protein